MSWGKIPTFSEVQTWAQNQGWITESEAPVQSVDGKLGDVEVIVEQDTEPSDTSVLWKDTSGSQPQAKIYNPSSDEWASVGVVDYTELNNQPLVGEVGSSGGFQQFMDETQTSESYITFEQTYGMAVSTAIYINGSVSVDATGQDVFGLIGKVNVTLRFEFYSGEEKVDELEFTDSEEGDGSISASVSVNETYNVTDYTSVALTISTSADNSDIAFDEESEYSVTAENEAASLAVHSHPLI